MKTRLDQQFGIISYGRLDANYNCHYTAMISQGSVHLDGGYKRSGDIRAEQRGHVQFPHVFLLSQGAGDALLA